VIKFLHTRVRVADPAASIAFYQKLGFELGVQKTSPQGNQLAFLHLPGNDHFLELTHSPNYKVEVPGGWREKFSTGERKMAFVTDPDGYEVEILEK